MIRIPTDTSNKPSMLKSSFDKRDKSSYTKSIVFLFNILKHFLYQFFPFFSFFSTFVALFAWNEGFWQFNCYLQVVNQAHYKNICSFWFCSRLKRNLMNLSLFWRGNVAGVSKIGKILMGKGCIVEAHHGVIRVSLILRKFFPSPTEYSPWSPPFGWNSHVIKTTSRRSISQNILHCC